MFFQKPQAVSKTLNSDEYEKVLKRILDLESRISSLELSEKAFKDKILRKINPKPAENEAEMGEKPLEIRDYRFFGGGGGR